MKKVSDDAIRRCVTVAVMLVFAFESKDKKAMRKAVLGILDDLNEMLQTDEIRKMACDVRAKCKEMGRIT